MIATTTNAADDPVVELARRLGFGVFRGSEHDVLGRIVGAAREFRADIIVEVTSDCIVIDPAVMRQCVDAYLVADADYVGNVLVRTYPVGMDTQVYATSLIEEVSRITRDPEDREHVSLYIYRHPEKYRLLNVTAAPEAVWPDLHLTLDTQEDYAMLKALYEGLYPVKRDFDVADIIAFLKAHPEIIAKSQDVVRKKSASEYFDEIRDTGGL